MAGIYANVTMDTDVLREFASGIRRASELTGDAASRADKARNHEKWQCSEKWQVTNEIDQLKAHSQRISGFLDKLSVILEQSAGEFETGQQKTLSGMGSAELKNV